MSHPFQHAANSWKVGFSESGVLVLLLTKIPFLRLADFTLV
jgi:hypothetical protein